MTLHIAAPVDSGPWNDLLVALLARVVDPTLRYVDCGPGWYPLLAELEQELAAKRPDTRLSGIRERDGDLVIAVVEGDDTTDAIVGAAVARAAQTCELTGAAGLAMLGPSGRRVLNPATAPTGWRIAPQPLQHDANEQNRLLLDLLVDMRSRIEKLSEARE
jgi:hypothetical protein